MSFGANHNDHSFEGPTERWSHSAASVKPSIAIFTRSYPPAYLKGGPARSLYALVETLAAEFRFSVVTSASDDSATGPMQSVELGRWSTFGRAATWYESRNHMRVRTAVKLLKETEPQLIYLNSLFDYCFAILPLLIARILFWRVPIVLAPRGELSAGALALKRWKKRAFVAAFRLLRLHEYVTWHASTTQEKADIECVFGPKIRSHVAIDLRTDLFDDKVEQDQSPRRSGDPRSSSLVFLSRIVPKKNVSAVIRAMLLVKGNVCLSIAGPIEDAKYWGRCLELINDMPESRSIKYLGPILPDEVVTFLSRFDLFVLPTLGENFGHVVLESLAAGTPVIVGKDTPWHRIETSGAGWVCDPANPGAIAELIERFLSLDEDARQRMRTAARSLAIEVVKDPSSVNANRSMFRALTSTESRR
jgi:glycosyltransferase involved in cell wall biosynthesis